MVEFFVVSETNKRILYKRSLLSLFTRTT